MEVRVIKKICVNKKNLTIIGIVLLIGTIIKINISSKDSIESSGVIPLKLISINKALVLEDEKLKVYDLEENKIVNEVESANLYAGINFNTVEVFEGGVVWSEETVDSMQKSYKIYQKKYSDEGKTLIGESKKPIPIGMDYKGGQFVYYLNDGEKDVLNIYVVEEGKSEELHRSSSVKYISNPSIEKDKITWGTISNGEYKVYLYNLKNKKIDILSDKEKMVDPMIIENKIIGIEEYDHEESDGLKYASDNIVEFDFKNKKWERFKEVDECMDEPTETVSTINKENSDGLFYWRSSFNDGECIYDLKNEKVYRFKDKDFRYNIWDIKGRDVLYKKSYNDGRENDEIYVMSVK